jgi:hypothetical protein
MPETECVLHATYNVFYTIYFLQVCILHTAGMGWNSARPMRIISICIQYAAMGWKSAQPLSARAWVAPLPFDHLEAHNL